MFIAHGSVKISTNTCDAMFFDKVPTVSEYIYRFWALSEISFYGGCVFNMGVCLVVVPVIDDAGG